MPENEILIKIGDKDVGFRATASLTYRYKEAFGEEYLVDLDNVLSAYSKDQVSLCMQQEYKLLWCMAQCYADAHGETIQPIVAWLDTFGYGEFRVHDVWLKCMPILDQNFKIDRKNE